MYASFVTVWATKPKRWQMKLLRLLLTLLLAFVMLSSVAGGINLILFPNGTALHLHTGMLQNTPFSNFLLPGIISLVVTGGSSLLALVLARDRSIYTLPAAILCGLTVIVWTSLVTLCLKNISAANLVYWAVGVALVVISLYLQNMYDQHAVASSSNN
jgi:hypothetical protein